MSDDRAEYRKLAEICLRNAENISGAEDKAHWLRLANAWAMLALSGGRVIISTKAETALPAWLKQSAHKPNHVTASGVPHRA